MPRIKWIRIAEHEDLLPWQANDMCVIEADGKKMTLARIREDFFVFAHKCPHASGILADGFIDATGNVVCPVHRYKFDMRNGRNVSGEGYHLKTYVAEKRADGIFLGIEERGLFHW